MRLVQVVIPAGKRQTVLAVLDDEGIDYVLTDESSGRKYTGVVYFPLPVAAVEPILERLREVGLDDQAYTVVMSAETVVSRQYEQLEEEYAERESTDQRIAREELKARAEDLVSSPPVYVAMTVVSAIIATAGLLLDSPATVVGSMVIAPLIGPSMSAAVGTVIDDDALARRGFLLQVVGMSLAIIAAAAFAAFVDVVNLIPPTLDPGSLGQVQERVAPDFLSLAVALGAGTAGAVSLMTGVSSALVGVMIAVALVPPAATVGIGIAIGDPSMVLSSGVLAVVNGLSINLAALAVLWYAGYRPQRFFRVRDARATTVRRVALILAAIALLSVFLGGVTYDSYQSARTQQAIEGEVEPVFEEGAYAELTLFDLEVESTPEEPLFIFHRPTRVVATVGVPPTGRTAGLLSTLETHVERAVDRNVDVQIRYVESESTG